ncbi:chromosome segregation protein SMC [Allostreptomyces psammosilenae]|uniref:Chromosome partition protein Smc n=1 Tax=Allostreptomyces psammosilenae TaxID=1892865 RepID=A0A852ZZF1_9ACTN|nr:chromosome segregation protein SMC [Allostreptomyces psammosilenae]NYI06600.1 chromosome segregation protein [Allostreptomyces psammosilenae]
MHLKTLTLRGFKSFASTTTLRLEPGITCVVGPNGSGKSNVVDALSWVMGEQGAKSLRGGKMEDVIFAGTTGRPPLGRAEVSLTIDNSDGALPIDYTEVTITRTMFRNGGSEYAINGDTCRLLDIQELLSDSGIGREMHVIVGQGQLDSVLHADPAGRRAFIEEAAGVLKHRKRKEKALRKLDAMQANLTRVQDLAAELRRQLAPLGRQARVARRAGVIQAELRDARMRLLADDLVTLRDALEAETADEAALRERRAVVEAQLAAAQRREGALETSVAALGPRLAEAQDTWYRLSQLAERVRGTVGLARQRARHAASAAAGADERRGRDPEDMEREARRVREQEAELAEAVEAARAALEGAVERRAEVEQELTEEERRLRDAARALADRREGLARLRGQVAAARGRAASAEAETARLAVAAEEARERAERARLEYEELRAEVEGAAGGAGGAPGADAPAGAADLERRLAEATSALEEAERAQGEAREAVTAAERERAALTARHEALSLGVRRKDGSGALLEAGDRLAGPGRGGVLGPAAELLTVEAGWEEAVAAALAGAADAVVVADPATAVAALELLRADDAGRAALLLAAPGPASGPAPHDLPTPAALPDLPPGCAPVADLVGVADGAPAGLLAAVRELLRGVVAVPDLTGARALVERHPELTAVTRGGDLLGARRADGGSPGAPSLLQVQAAVDEAAARLDELAEECARLAERHEAARAARSAAAELVRELTAERRRVEQAASAAAAQLGRLGGHARAAEGEAERLSAAASRSAAAGVEAAEAAAELEERLAVAEEAPVEEEPDTGRRDELAARATAARQAEMEARLALRTHEERARSLAGRADALDRGARAEREARARAEERRRRAGRERRVAEAVTTGAEALLAFTEVSLERAAAARAEVERERSAREEELAAERSRARDLAAELEKLTDTVHRDEVLRAEKRLRVEQLENRAMEEFGVSPETLVAEYGPDQLIPPVVEPEEGDLPAAGRPAADAETTDGVTGDGSVSGRPAAPAPSRRRRRSGGEAEGAAAEPRPYVRAEQQERARRAEREYAKLGKINPLALEEFAALEERHRFLTEQLEDLKATRRDLLTVVQEVDERVREVFAAAFRDTAREFEGVFSRLFPGGDGRLVLTDPDDMLTTGVEVEARPPGKKVKRLSLLSGGERSLTAVALLVAIFKARPSPFYVMDEVEAALDDTNLQRLIGIMAELRESSQLIVITHQKRTMEIADALYGVSMKGDGVSEVISQRLGDRRRAPAADDAGPGAGAAASAS